MVTEAVQNILAKVLAKEGPIKIRLSDYLKKDLHMDDADIYESLVLLEAKYHIDLLEDSNEIKTVRDIVDLTRAQLYGEGNLGDESKDIPSKKQMVQPAKSKVQKDIWHRKDHKKIRE